ncbi:MAG: hypothetical protein ABWK00_05885 [Desulfurococcaceae archaeon]
MGGEPVLGRGLTDELLYLIANLLALEEHLFELGDLEAARRVREARREVVERLSLLLSGRPARETRLRATWCALKHALLAWYHAYEAALASGDGELAGISRDLLGAARGILEESFKPTGEGQEGGGGPAEGEEEGE